MGKRYRLSTARRRAIKKTWKSRSIVEVDVEEEMVGPTFDPKTGLYLRRTGLVQERGREEEEEEQLSGRKVLSPELAASSPENLQTITSNMKKGMKKSLSSRLGPVDPSVQQQQFSEKEIYEEILRQRERRRIAIEEKVIRKLKKAMKKKEKLERKLKKHDRKESKKKSKKVLDDDSDFSEGDMLASLDLLKAKQEQLAQAPAKADVDSDEELYRFFEEPETERKEKRGRHTAEEGRAEKKKKVGSKKRWTSGDSGEGEGKRSRRSSGEGGLRAPNNPTVKSRPLNMATTQSKLKAKSVCELHLPNKARPATSTATARRLLQWALGSDKKVPAASKVEQHRLREAIKNKEEERNEGECCSEPDTFSAASHVLPGYKICSKELAQESVWDSHCHLDFLARRLNRENVEGGESLQKSLQSDGQKLGEKFGGCIANFCDPRDWAQGPRSQEVSKILTSCKEQSGVFLTLGCHPHFADKMDGFCIQQLLRLARKMKGRVVAIGECGLDKSGKNRVPMETQKKYFEAQIDIARELNLPLVLHIRDAEDEAMELLKKKKVPANFRIHYHCFTGTWKAAEDWLSAYPASKIGLTGLVTFDHARSVHDVARRIPLEKLLLETDAPYFLPSGVSKASYKHTFSMPGHVVHVAAQVAALRRISLSEVLAANRKNIKDIYDC